MCELAEQRSTNRLVSCVPVALLAAVLVGCAPSDKAPETPKAGTPTAGTTSAAATSTTTQTSAGTPDATSAPPTGPTENDELGRPAALGCAEGAPTCDVEFTVKSAQQNVQCDDASTKLGPNEQWLRFELEVTAAPEFDYDWSGTAFSLANWAVERPDGTADSGLTFSNQCSDNRVPLIEPLTPGARVTTNVVIVAPKPAAALKLAVNELSWSWRLAE